jgi:hypothetical protein
MVGQKNVAPSNFQGGFSMESLQGTGQVVVPSGKKIKETGKGVRMDEWDLGLIPWMLLDRVKEKIENKDAIGLLCLMKNTDGLAFVFDNMLPLKRHGLYEKA